jgi:hypothetical protein
MLGFANRDPEFLKTVIAGDVTWDMTQKWRYSHHSGSILHPEGPKRHTGCGAKSRCCWLFSLTIVGLCITVMHQKAKQSTKNTIWKSSVIFVMQFSTRDWTCEPHTIDSCFMTMLWLIHHPWSRVSWPNTSFQLFTRLPTLQTWLLVISGCSPNWRGNWKVPFFTVART